jgi:hypothetical protein
MPGMGSKNQGTGMYTLDGKTYRWPATRKKVEVLYFVIFIHLI